MDYIEEFMNHKIGLDVLNSDSDSVTALSEIINIRYDRRLYDYKDLVDYYDYILTDKIEKPWTILVYETDMKCWNAYRGWSQEEYLKEGNVMKTAHEIIGISAQKIMITEDEMDDLLCLK